jgi:hypothetical protein
MDEISIIKISIGNVLYPRGSLLVCRWHEVEYYHRKKNLFVFVETFLLSLLLFSSVIEPVATQKPSVSIQIGTGPFSFPPFSFEISHQTQKVLKTIKITSSSCSVCRDTISFEQRTKQLSIDITRQQSTGRDQIK